MKPEHDEIIEAMVAAIGAPFGWDELSAEDRKEAVRDFLPGLRAAAERGWVLAKIPEPMNAPGPGECCAITREGGWNACLDAIEIIEMEGSND